jgi:predicted RNase H-like HicB family nuclease
MITDYINAALQRAHYEMIDDEEPFYGEIPQLPGVYATGKTLEECRNNLQEVLEGRLIVSLRRDLPVPPMGDITFDSGRRSAV